MNNEQSARRHFLHGCGIGLGATALAQLLEPYAAAGTPAILVPYPHATGDHQTLNARHFVDGGGAVLVPDDALDARAAATIGELLGDPDRLARMSAAMRSLARPHAAEQIADELVALARG